MVRCDIRLPRRGKRARRLEKRLELGIRNVSRRARTREHQVSSACRSDAGLPHLVLHAQRAAKVMRHAEVLRRHKQVVHALRHQRPVRHSRRIAEHRKPAQDLPVLRLLRFKRMVTVENRKVFWFPGVHYRIRILLLAQGVAQRRDFLRHRTLFFTRVD